MPPITPTPQQFAKTIYGIHDIEASSFLTQNQVSGWLVHTVNVNTDAPTDYTSLVNAGMRVLVRLNNGYGSDGTIPVLAQYDAFAQKCADWVAASKNAQLWIIGNEMNLSAERPQGQPILPVQYAGCFLKCRDAIHAKAGHANDLVLVGPVGPYNVETTYPANPSGDWIKYFQDILNYVLDRCDGVTIHTYSRGNSTASITDEATYPAPYNKNHKSFRAYRDFMNAIPVAMRGLPVFITETQTLIDDVPTWANQNTGWVQAAYSEIHSWSAIGTNQPIQALVLFRWKREGPAGWSLQNFPAVLDDTRAAFQSNYQVVLPKSIAPAPQTLEQAVLARANAAKPWMPVNNQAALWKYAQTHKLQDQQTDELTMTFSGSQYLVQVFNLGIVYVKVGDWGNIKVIPK